MLLLDNLERWVIAERQVAAASLGMGERLEPLRWTELREQFDEALDAPFERVDPAAVALREAVGLRGR